MKIVMEPIRYSQETLSTENMAILRNFQYGLKFLVSYKKLRVSRCIVVKVNQTRIPCVPNFKGESKNQPRPQGTETKGPSFLIPSQSVTQSTLCASAQRCASQILDHPIAE